MGLVMSMGVVVGSVEATIAEKVPIGGRNYSANDQGYLGLDTHFTGGHVDMHVGSVRLCGSSPFYFYCIDISYWVPSGRLK